MRLSENATIPSKAYEESAGYDIASAEKTQIKPHSVQIIKTDLAIVLPKETYGRIAERSSLAVNSFIAVGGGVIDAGFRVGIGVILSNHSDKTFKVEKGQRIAQLIIEKICPVKLIEVDWIDKTSRGNKGFGSSGE